MQSFAPCVTLVSFLHRQSKRILSSASIVVGSHGIPSFLFKPLLWSLVILQILKFLFLPIMDSCITALSRFFVRHHTCRHDLLPLGFVILSATSQHWVSSCCCCCCPVSDSHTCSSYHTSGADAACALAVVARPVQLIQSPSPY